MGLSPLSHQTPPRAPSGDTGSWSSADRDQGGLTHKAPLDTTFNKPTFTICTNPQHDSKHRQPETLGMSKSEASWEHETQAKWPS